jgi:O-antigen/teichoic acid export membrane protein
MISRQIEANAGPVIVGRLIGLADVTVYAVGVKISVLVRQFTFPMAVALFPAFSELNALDDRARLAVLLTQGLRASALVGMPLAGITIILARPLISVWVGPQFVEGARIATVMTLQVLVLQQLLATSSLLTGIGKLRLYALLHILAMLFSVAFALFLAPRWGSLAVALGSLLAWGGVLLVTMPYTAQLATVRLGDLFEKSLLRPLAATSVMCLGLFILRSWHYPATLPALLGQVSAAGLVYLFLAWNYCFNAAERKVYLKSVRKVILGLSPISS